MYTVARFISFTISLALFFGIVLVIIYAISNKLTDSRMYYSSPRWVRNFLDKLVDVSARFGPFFIIIFILGRLALNFLSLAL